MRTGWLPARGAPRTLALATAINTMGNGAFVTTSVLYFTRIVGLSSAQVGIGLSIAGVAGLVAGVPFGHLADTRGPRGVAASLTTAAGVATAAYIFLDSFAVFVVVAAAYALFDRGAYAARQALIGGLLEGTDLVRTRAYLRAVTNVGISVGAALASLALQLDTSLAYRSALALDAISFVVSGAVFLRLPAVARAARRSAAQPRLPVLRDKPYATLTLVNMAMLLHVPLLEVALPLWIVRHTDAPRPLVAALVLVNTAMVVLFQVRVSKGIETLQPAVTAMRRAGFALLAACAVFALSSQGGAPVAVVLLLVGAVLHVYGEMTQSAGSWVISFDLAPADRLGQYQGLFNTGIAVTQTFAPVVLVYLLIDWGVPGWFVLGGVFVAAALAMGPAVRWAEREKLAAASEATASVSA